MGNSPSQGRDDPPARSAQSGGFVATKASYLTEKKGTVRGRPRLLRDLEAQAFSATARSADRGRSTLPPAPTSGTLSNGVEFDVTVGEAHPTQGYVFFPAQSPQIWTFDLPVSLRFGLRGLNLSGECFRLPVGALAESINPLHNFNPSTRLLCRNAGSGPTTEVFGRARLGAGDRLFCRAQSVARSICRGSFRPDCRHSPSIVCPSSPS